MQTASLRLTPADFDGASLEALRSIVPDLVLAFFSTAAVRHGRLLPGLKRRFGTARVVGCSTAGEISREGVSEDGVVLVAIRFAQADFRVVAAPLPAMAESAAAGRALAQQLQAPTLRSVIVFAPGVEVNGSALIDGLTGGLHAGVAVTGGLAGDSGAFQQTWTLIDDHLDSRQAVAIGLYGDGVHLAHGSFGGWQPFGPVREVTRASGNVLHELDGEPALEIYRRYLGDHARDLPPRACSSPSHCSATTIARWD